MTGLGACQRIEEKSSAAQDEQWRLMWILTALRLLDSPSFRVRQQAVFTLAEACPTLSSGDRLKLVNVALGCFHWWSYSASYVTVASPAVRQVAARIFRFAQPSQLPMVLPLLVGLMQCEMDPDCLIELCESIRILVDSYGSVILQPGVATQAVALLRHTNLRVRARANLLSEYWRARDRDSWRRWLPLD